MALISVVFDVSSTLMPSTGIDQVSAQVLIRQLAFGGVHVSLLLEAETADEAVEHQVFLDSLDAPSSVASAATQPGTCAAMLRMLIEQTGVASDATCIVVSEQRLQRLAKLCPPACQLISLRSPMLADPVQQPGGSPEHSIVRVQDLLQTIVRSHADAAAAFVIAYAMKPSRTLALAERGFFPLVAVDGLSFLPLDLRRDLQPQGPFHAILHKASDEIALGAGGKPHFSAAFDRVLQYQAQNPDVLLIDPLTGLQKVLDRASLLTLLQQLPQPAADYSLRPPASHIVNTASEWHGVSETTARLGMQPPFLVKPSIACGVSEAHAMTVVLREQGFAGVECLLPACVQEYVDHGAALHKVYVIGSEVHVVAKHSLPDLKHLTRAELESLPAAVPFDSLQGVLPQELHAAASASTVGLLDPAPPLNRQLVELCATWLRAQLGLHLFGFDVIVQQSTGDHVVVDINYFPSFKEVPAAAAKIRIAILQALSEATG